MDQKIWGHTQLVFQNDTTTVHILYVRKGGVCSLHYHDFKYNHFHVVRGKFAVRKRIGKASEVWVPLDPEDTFTVDPKQIHEFEALEYSIVIETCWVPEGKIDLGDIHRLRLGYYKYGKGKIKRAPDDGTVEELHDESHD